MGIAERQRHLRRGRCKGGGRDNEDSSLPSSRRKPRRSRSTTDSGSELMVSVQRISSCSRRGQCQSSLEIGSKLAIKGSWTGARSAGTETLRPLSDRRLPMPSLHCNEERARLLNTISGMRYRLINDGRSGNRRVRWVSTDSNSTEEGAISERSSSCTQRPGV